jgi:hypothetical protein
LVQSSSALRLGDVAQASLRGFAVTSTMDDNIVIIINSSSCNCQLAACEQQVLMMGSAGAMRCALPAL